MGPAGDRPKAVKKTPTRNLDVFTDNETDNQSEALKNRYFFPSLQPKKAPPKRGLVFTESPEP
jgi:hypothetical protein